MRATHDRGEIMHFIGRQHGSPALKKASGEPVISVGHDDPEAQRVGWASFFAAMTKRHLELANDPEAGTHRWLPRGSPLPA